jgi:hypothetical protein
MPGTSRIKDQEMGQGRTNDNFQGRAAGSGEKLPSILQENVNICCFVE